MRSCRAVISYHAPSSQCVRTPHGKMHFMVTCGTIVDADMRVISVGQRSPGVACSPGCWAFTSDAVNTVAGTARLAASPTRKSAFYRAGRSNPIGQSPIFFHTVAAANKARKAALKQLLNKLNT
jgi:hypothetical protein